MSVPSATSVLASFATLKILNDEKKYGSPYQLLSEFINYIIITQNLYYFNSIQMKNELYNIFGFDVPEAVVKTALKNLEYVKRDNGAYIVVAESKVVNDSFEKSKVSAELEYSNIIESLEKFVGERVSAEQISKDKLIRELIAFLIDDQENPCNQYTELISEFVLKNETDVDLQKSLDAIKEGSILYIGLNFNINETGSLKKNLTLYLCTEVLFSLAGFNGDIHEKLARDFFTLVQNANSNGTKIRLRYFPEIKKEIDEFFGCAASIVEGKMRAIDKPAMRAIITGCATSADVVVKKADFFHTLEHRFGITEDDTTDYYSEEYNQYNLEDREYTGDQAFGWRLVSHINKQRKGKVFSDNLDSEFLVVTNKKATLFASKEQSDKDIAAHDLGRVNDYAVSVNSITNLLWYKMGYGFGGEDYPKNVNAALRARIVLASLISRKVSEVFEDSQERYSKGELSEDKLMARILTLHKKPILPEELTGETIEEIMDFSPEFISHYEEEINRTKIALEERDGQILELKADRDRRLQAKDQEIAGRDKQISMQNEENSYLAEQLAMYQEKEKEEQLRLEKKNRIKAFVFSVAKKMIAIVVLILTVAFVQSQIESKVIDTILIGIDVLGFLIWLYSVLKDDWVKLFSKEN